MWEVTVEIFSLVIKIFSCWLQTWRFVWFGGVTYRLVSGALAVAATYPILAHRETEPPSSSTGALCEHKLKIQAKPKSILNRPKASNPPFSRCILPSLWNKTTCYQQTTGAQCALHVTTIYLEKSKETKRCDLQPPQNKRIVTRETESCALWKKESLASRRLIGFWASE